MSDSDIAVEIEAIDLTLRDRVAEIHPTGKCSTIDPNPKLQGLRRRIQFDFNEVPYIGGVGPKIGISHQIRTRMEVAITFHR